MNDRISPSFASFLNLSRAISAVLVFLNHLRDPLFVGYPELPPDQRGMIVRGWFFLTGFGFAAVMVFFVLSGFLVGGMGLSKIRQGTFQPSAYFIDRFSRLFIVLLPALLLTAVLDYVGMRYFHSLGFWDRTNPNIAAKFAEPFAYRGWKAFACNLVMLQSFQCPFYGSNVPLWSLSYEFWFYICFGAIAVAISSAGSYRSIALLCFGAIVVGLGMAFVWLAAIWLFGVAAHSYERKSFRWPWLAIPVFLATAVATRVIDPGRPVGNIFNNLLMLAEGAAFAWVLVSMRNVESHLLVKLAPFGHRLASFSFTLYLIHFPVMLILVALAAKILGLGTLSHGVPPASPLGILLYVGIVAIVLAIAWLFASLTERQTHHLRGWLRSLFMVPARNHSGGG